MVSLHKVDELAERVLSLPSKAVYKLRVFALQRLEERFWREWRGKRVTNFDKKWWWRTEEDGDSAQVLADAWYAASLDLEKSLIGISGHTILLFVPMSSSS